MTKIQEALDALDEVKQAINSAYASGYAAGSKTRQWVSLTDDEIKAIIGPWGVTPFNGYTRELFDKIEEKLKEKNT